MASARGLSSANWTRIVAGTLLLGALPWGAVAGGAGTSVSFQDMFRQGPGEVNHPVNVVPSDSVNVPDDWPLNAQGQITCLTCHTGFSGSGAGKNAMLRDFDSRENDSREFCGKCHTTQGGRSAGNTHWMAMQVAHVGAGSARPKRSADPIDGESKQCLTCHDGVSARESPNTIRLAGSTSFSDTDRNHPIGVRYPMGGYSDDSRHGE